MSVGTVPRPRFTVPEGGDADRPPERRGLARDGVRLLSVAANGLGHHRFHDLPDLLEPGDLVVVNTSPTLPAAVDATDARGAAVPLHISTSLDDGSWVVEARLPDGSGPDLERSDGDVLLLPGGLRMLLGQGYPVTSRVSRLRQASISPWQPLVGYLTAHGRPITYGYVSDRFELAEYQTVYATTPRWGPGSAEMASAGRPLTTALITRLSALGIATAPIELHSGVSSPELHEPPSPERFVVPEATARLVRSTREGGRRVVAVGTTVVRALETATDSDGVTRADCGWTDLVLSPESPVRVVTGLITGLHAPEASHLMLLEAVAGRDLVARAYEAAVAEHYLWHEFGDSMLFLP